MQSIKTFYFLSNGLWFVRVEVFNCDGKLVRVSVIQVIVQGVCYWDQRCGATRERRLALGANLRPQLFACLVGLYHNIHEASINYILWKNKNIINTTRSFDHLQFNLQEPCFLYIGRAYRYPPDVAFYIFFFNNCKYWVF